MTKIRKRESYWVTASGDAIPISGMTTTHLLNAIHVLERGRCAQLVELSNSNGWVLGGADMKRLLRVYASWPVEYDDLLAEAEKRGIIRRR